MAISFQILHPSFYHTKLFTFELQRESKSLDSSVSVVKGLQYPGNTILLPQTAKELVSPPKRSDRVRNTINPWFSRYWYGYLCPQAKRSKREAYYSLLFSVEVKNEWMYTLISPYAFMIKGYLTPNHYTEIAPPTYGLRKTSLYFVKYPASELHKMKRNKAFFLRNVDTSLPNHTAFQTTRIYCWIGWKQARGKLKLCVKLG